MRLYERDSGELIAETTSSGGYYYLPTAWSGSAHFVVAMDDLAGETYNDLIIGRIYPTMVSG